jgi:2-dehydro-3-deoxyphosphogluconate aldolase / (4S)-4-hydroxy-2-oxoglutarate aldolase
MTNATDVITLLAASPVLPVVTIDDAGRGPDLARALAAGGLRAVEITLRTPAALDAIARIAAAVPEMLVAAGTVLTPADLRAAAASGAALAISPGATPALLEAARDDGIPYLPGIATASELMIALEAGYACCKFFPATAAGGVATLDALAGPFPAARFCPTGGISTANAAEFLARPNVVCVGGSWIAPRAAIARGDWAAIERAAREAAGLRGAR